MPQLSDYLAKITSEYQNSPKFKATVALFIQPFIDNQNLWATMPIIFNLNTAMQYALPETNFVFDWIGKWVGAVRNGLDDATFCTLLRAMIAIDHWDGTVPGIYSLWATVFNGSVQVLVQDNQDMTMFLVFVQQAFTPAELTLLLSGAFDLRPAGVKMLGYYQPSSAGHPVFGLGIENDSIAGIGVGYFVAPIAV